MPILRYFVFVGGALLALLLVVNWSLPPLDAETGHAGADHSAIRIHSQHKWPAAVVIDTTLPTIVPPQAPVVAEAPAARPPREAFAMAEATPAVKPDETVKPAKPHVRRPRTARAPAGYDMFGIRNDTFGYRSTWPSGW